MTKKELIFNAGAKLFARHSYSSVGIREIAAEAGVNSAMISYYYGGKGGLLRDVFRSFSSLLINTLQTSLEESDDMNEFCAKFIRCGVYSARENRDVYLVGLHELNRDYEELQDLHTSLDVKGWEMFLLHLDRLEIKGLHDENDRHINFVAITGLIFSDYLVGGGKYIDDDDLVENYIKLITQMMQFGQLGIWS